MKKLDIKLYKMEVIKGKEELAKEWLQFLKDNSAAGVETLKNERIYLETYFTAVENGTMCVYLFIAGDNIAHANSTALESSNELDLKHFAYMKNCIDLAAGDIMDVFCYMNNISDYLS